MSATGPDEIIATFDHPPVAEVVAAVRVAELSDQTFMAVGELWKSKFSEFPKFELQPPYDVPVEAFEAGVPRAPFSDLRLFTQPPLSRVWFTDASGQELIQVQHDWFAVNWRKVEPDNEYGNWPARRAAFEGAYGKFAEWAEGNGDSITPTQCEVTYINHVLPIAGVWSTHADSPGLFRGRPGDYDTPHPLEEIRWQARYLLNGEDGSPRGRLHVSAQPVFRASDATPMMILELTARVVPSGPGLESALEALDAGRAAIVRTFLSTTSDEAQKAWGLK